MKPNLAIVSPSQSAYSETFIQAHKCIPDMNVHYYYGGVPPSMLEGKGKLLYQNTLDKIFFRIKTLVRKSTLSLAEDSFIRSLRREKIDCLLAEYGPTGVGVLSVCKESKTPLIVYFHGYDASKRQVLEQYKNAYKDMFQYARGVMVVSRRMQKDIEELGCPIEKIIYSPCGPHHKFVNIKPKLNQKLFISVGRFVDKKAHYYTILAFKNALEKHPDAKLVIAGDGILLNACINLVRHLKIEHAVSFPGVISQDRFMHYLEIARAYVQHSITALDGDMEGTPVSVMEASAAGIPVISTHHGGIPDVVVHGETGLLVEEHNVDEMSNQMLKVLEDFNYARKLGETGKVFISENFSLEKHLSLISHKIKTSL